MSLDNMKKRMNFYGNSSDGRLVNSKYLSFKSSLNNSYQGENITFKRNKYRCLINQDRLKEDYDQKEISIDFDAGMKNGDVFYWDRTDSYWIVYLQNLSEEAYFRASIRKCNYSIEIGNDTYWVYVRGPLETSLVWRQKHEITFNEMNYSLCMYVTADDITNEYFKRFQIVKFDGHNWRVAATDRYSQDGIIEVYLEEYYDNQFAEPASEETPRPTKGARIEGPASVRPFDTEIHYSVVGMTDGTFSINSNKVELVNITGTTCDINILTGKSGSFILTYQNAEKTIFLNITIKSL